MILFAVPPISDLFAKYNALLKNHSVANFIYSKFSHRTSFNTDCCVINFSFGHRSYLSTMARSCSNAGLGLIVAEIWVSVNWFVVVAWRMGSIGLH